MRRSLLVCTLLFLCCCFTALAQTKIAVTGTIKDAKGTPLPGVTVKEKGVSNGAMSNPDGSFKLSVPAEGTLVVSYVGFVTQEIPVAGKTNIDVTLQEDNKNLNEVVVTAMGIKRESRALGYAVSTVSSKDLTQTASPSIGSALYGKAAGVKITQAPGGAAGGVSIQVRGVSSVGLNTQPLYVIDGVPLRNFSNPGSNSFGTSNGRIESNGANDINPEDIESLTVLKGASATALYGSEATNGVIVITTKKGAKGKNGLGVEANYSYNQEKLAMSPDYQNEYGPGYNPALNLSATNGQSRDGWFTETDGAHHPYYRAYGSFGAKFDGREVTYWDGTKRKYEAQPNNYKDFYQTGYNSQANVAISNANDKGSFRFSYTRLDYKSIMPGSNLYKNNFNFNGTLKLSERVSLDVVSSYNNFFNHNRPNVLSNVTNSFGGFFSRFDDMNVYKTRFQTRDGYKYVLYNNTSYGQEDKFLYNIRANQLLDYFWDNLRNSYDETQNRFINSATLSIKLLDNLTIRGRAGGDFTNLYAADMRHNEKPARLGYSGMYATENRNNNVFYGDVLAVYNPKLTKDLDMTVTGGYTARKTTYKYNKISSNGGLVSENWFSIGNSAQQATVVSERATQYDVAGFGIINFAYKGFLYIEGTGRYESTNTLPVAVNSYFYPSFNAGFILSDVVKMPKAISYAKIRGSYGFVGNHPNLYQSNVLYTQYGVAYGNNNLLYQQPNSKAFGNANLKSEKKRESEIGLETRLLDNKISVDLSYYNNKVNDQILFRSIATTTGAASQLVNAGDISNYGFEAAISATPIDKKDFRWNTRFNFAVNRNKLTRLPDGQTFLDATNLDNQYVVIRSQVGESLGNIYIHPRETDGKGNMIVDENGVYTLNKTDYVKAGNILPKLVGGFSNTLSYKNFALDFTLDYRFGGNLISTPTYYMYGAGMLKSSLQYRDAARGGLSYHVEGNEQSQDTKQYTYVLDANGPYHDGVILPGVKADGSKNDRVISAADHYFNNYQWGETGDYSAAIFKNNYIKLREVAVTYNIPKAFSDKLHFQGLQVSLIGRNLLYVYKSLPKGLDPEVGVGSMWWQQGIDNGTAGPTRSYGASIRARF
ncbi:SusC/RagA family TonB-linked outer membrane protein [Chitinophaga pinensis]|uniref:TonB-dependent receptor plug n=1 Tax=Chitinophaga pinensis (strain ATCC 43595 / DSM 2588 / LMG 13176 / NBRC 15968 / NCIMB 11800 / UQM 2034) TaxID=485918 RepID=A0A979G2F3_CHIPD|nr:SusC/RagA family TonB-linked outer membrane protein [Chitinophaga pinensis]ACU59393.1 TonB-dependent receptor plug [Chitinophaga pinensis DSM 2588]